METFEAIRTVLAIRAYQDKPIPPETVRRIIEAGHLTGSSMNKQPWHFMVIQDPDMLQRIGGIARSGTYIAQARLGPSLPSPSSSPSKNNPALAFPMAAAPSNP